MYRRLEYQHDYFGDVEIAKNNKKKHFPVIIHAENISLSLSRHNSLLFWRPEKEVFIYQNLSFEIPFGKLFGIIGPDVAVCSSVIHTLANKLPGVNKNASTNTPTSISIANGVQFTHGGNVYYNETYPTKDILSKIDFVGKENDFYPFLTVRETILHFAKIQYPQLDEEEMTEKVVRIITEMGLSSCGAKFIGSHDMKIETTVEDKIRLRIALQMLNSPSVLFLDDPFHDLDELACANLMVLFASICSRGPSVVFSLPPTRSQFTSKLTEVLVLNDAGECVYVGGAGAELESYLSGSGNMVEKGTNPVDTLLHVAHVQSNQQVNTLKEQFLRHKPPARTTNTSSTQKLPPELLEDFDPMHDFAHPPFASQLFPLFTQNARNLYRNKKLMMLYVMECVLVALLAPVIFIRLPSGKAQPWDTMGFCFFVAVLQSYILQVTNLVKVSLEIPPILQEYATAKRPRFFTSVVVARFLVQFLLDLGASALFCTIVYWISKAGSGDYSVVNFLQFAGVSMLVHFCAVSWAFMCGSLFGSFIPSFIFSTTVFVICLLGNGFLVNPTVFPSYLYWVQYLPFQAYGYELFLFAADQQNAGIFSGRLHELLLYMPLQDTHPIVFRVLVLILFVLVNHIVAGFLLWYLYQRKYAKLALFYTPIQRPVSGKKATASYNTFMDNKVAIPAKTCVGLMDMCAKIDSQEVLKGVSGIFRSGELVLALGNQVSGLRVLLDIVAGTYKDTFGTRSELSGGLHINNYKPHSQFLQRLVGYVHAGGMFFGTLTVKETMRYYAALKMSKSLPFSEKMKKADDLLREFGLSDKLYVPSCDLAAEFRIRLNIAVHLLNNPFIVIVDDQLNGLDFTATKDILELLKKVAQQGRIVICALPYAQSWMLPCVDALLLMSLGGVAYCGRSASAMRHFRKIGFNTPPSSDFLLHILSQLTVDSHSPSLEIETKNRIRAIKEKWNPSESLEEVLELQKLQFPKIQILQDIFGYEKFGLLLKRMITQRLRQPKLIALHILMPLLYGGIVCLVFANTLTGDLFGIQSRMGLILALNLLIVFGFMHGFLFFPKENEMFVKEQEDNSCTPSLFYSCYLVCDLMLNFVSAVMLAILVMFTNHMHATPEAYFAFTFVLMLIFASGHAFSIILISLVDSVQIVTAIFAVGVTLVLSFSAFVSTQLFFILDYTRYASILAHFSFVLAIHEFSGLEFNCDGVPLLLTHSCPVAGSEVASAFTLDPSRELLFLGLAFVCTVVYHIIAFICFSKLQRGLTKR